MDDGDGPAASESGGGSGSGSGARSDDARPVGPGDEERSQRDGSARGRWGPPAGERTPLGWARWAMTTDRGAVAYVRELLVSVAVVLVVGMLLFAISGVWPPMVAIESGSMEPNIHTGDLVFVMEEGRFPGPNPTVAAGNATGVVTLRTVERTGDPYTKFGRPGDVIVYRPRGQERTTPIIHRAHFWVNDSENWYSKADPDAVGTANNCRQLRNCPAPHAGFITKGDNGATNRQYDQLTGISGPVRPEWVVGTAEFRLPLLGYIRLGVGTAGPAGLVGPAAARSGGAGTGIGVPADLIGALGGLAVLLANREW